MAPSLLSQSLHIKFQEQGAYPKVKFPSPSRFATHMFMALFVICGKCAQSLVSLADPVKSQ